MADMQYRNFSEASAVHQLPKWQKTEQSHIIQPNLNASFTSYPSPPATTHRLTFYRRTVSQHCNRFFPQSTFNLVEYDV